MYNFINISESAYYDQPRSVFTDKDEWIFIALCSQNFQNFIFQFLERQLHVLPSSGGNPASQMLDPRTITEGGKVSRWWGNLCPMRFFTLT